MSAMPHLIHFSKIGESAIGFISVAENKNLPFKIERVYWTYFTPESVNRGSHAHVELEQIVIAVAGQIMVSIENNIGVKEKFLLTSPDQGLFIPKMCWREMKYSHNSVQLVFASTGYDEKDYIRDYDAFKKLLL
jgi:hypothetical protein